MNKIKILSLLPALVLCSCGAKKNKYVGTYQFRLGKSDGNHMEVTAVITDDNDPKAEGYKIMTLSGDLGEEFSILKQIEELEDVIDDFVEQLKEEGTGLIPPELIDSLMESLPRLVAALKEEVKSLNSIPFFYNVSEYKNEKYGNRLELGTHVFADIFQSVKTKLADLEDAEDLLDTLKAIIRLTGFFEEDLTVLPGKSKFAFNGFVGKKGITFQVPISKVDLEQQLIWYGYEDNIFSSVNLPTNYIEKMPGVKGENRFGTHPAKVIKNNVVTKDEAKEVNEMFTYEFSNSPLYDKTETDIQIARFKLDAEGETSKLIMLFDTEAAKKSAGTYEGVVKINSVNKDISLTVDDNGVCQVEHNGKKGLKEGFIDNNGQEFRFREVVNDPFEFRDYNVVNVGLAKVEA